MRIVSVCVMVFAIGWALALRPDSKTKGPLYLLSLGIGMALASF